MYGSKNISGLLNYVFIGVILYFLWRLLSGFRGDTMLGASYVAQSAGATITSAQAVDFAERLYNSIGWIDDDEEQIYAVFNELNNKADLFLVGQKLKSMHDYTLDQFVQTVNQSGYSTNDGTKQQINQILSSKGIDYQF